MHSIRFVRSFLLALSVVACGGDDGQAPGVDAGVDAAVTPDAADTSATGQPCDETTPCPGAAYCVSSWSNDTAGVCAEPCTSSCDYDGPGDAVCSDVGPSRRGCLITCGGPNPQANCPTGLACFDLQGDRDGLAETCMAPPTKYATLAVDDVALAVTGTRAQVDNADDEIEIFLLIDDIGGDGTLAVRVPSSTTPGTHVDCSAFVSYLTYSEPGGSGFSFVSDTPCDIRIDQIGPVGGIISGAVSARTKRPTATSTKRFINATFWIPRAADVP